MASLTSCGPVTVNGQTGGSVTPTESINLQVQATIQNNDDVDHEVTVELYADGVDVQRKIVIVEPGSETVDVGTFFTSAAGSGLLPDAGNVSVDLEIVEDVALGGGNGNGDECDSNADCGFGFICINGDCINDPLNGGGNGNGNGNGNGDDNGDGNGDEPECEFTHDCPPDEVCIAGVCLPEDAGGLAPTRAQPVSRAFSRF